MESFHVVLGGHIPRRQFGRYMLVGFWNTAFGYLSFVGLTAILSSVAHGYVLAGLLASLLNVTMAFLLYKHFVFRTKGNYFKEWTRCIMVYSSGIIVNLILLPILVQFLQQRTRYVGQAPYIAGAVLTGVGIVISFLGHRRFSFQATR